MTNEVRYQVFVSSTYTDLITERQAVMSALLQLGALPAGMELFPAADDEAWTLIKRVIDESDYYLLVVGGRYGSVDADGLSYTEKEYDYAVNQRKPVMAFLHQSPEKLPFENSEGDPSVRSKLADFRSRIEKAKHVKFWASAEDLSGKVALSFASFTRSYPSIGWVRGDAGDSPETLRRLNRAQERIAELERILREQAMQPPATAEGLADGDERFALDAVARIRISNLVYGASIASSQHLTVSCSITWNQTLSALGPAMLDEASQDDLTRRFQSAVHLLNVESVQKEANKWLRREVSNSDIAGYAKGKPVPKIDFALELVVNHTDFETALLQLDALGLIEKGSKKRPIADRSMYWALTSWGRTRLKALRAVRAGADRPREDELGD